MKACWKKHTLIFKVPSGTSRGVLLEKPSWFIILEKESKLGIGEVSIIPGLSPDRIEGVEAVLDEICVKFNEHQQLNINDYSDYPAIKFGLETALTSLASENTFELFPSEFTEGVGHIPINGLIWMGDVGFMSDQIEEKIEAGFNCIKMKIGSLDFNQELKILETIRSSYTPDQITLRVDANGAFKISEAMDKLTRLSEFGLHSIEQPIAPGNWMEMAGLCRATPLPIALDEELIGVNKREERSNLLKFIKPQFIILKPSLIGGLGDSSEWIDLADSMGIGWWITSALESNIGLNAIAQFTFDQQTDMPQGLGTGSLFTNNIDSPLIVKNGTLRYLKNKNWDIKSIKE